MGWKHRDPIENEVNQLIEKEGERNREKKSTEAREIKEIGSEMKKVSQQKSADNLSIW